MKWIFIRTVKAALLRVCDKIIESKARNYELLIYKIFQWDKDKITFAVGEFLTLNNIRLVTMVESKCSKDPFA